MTCASGRAAIVNFCPETWKIIGIGALFVTMLLVWFIFVSPNKQFVAKGVLRLFRVKRPGRWALTVRYLVPLIYWGIFAAITYFVIKSTEVESNKYVEGGGVSLGVIGLIGYIVLRDIILEAAKYGPRVLMEEAFDDGNYNQFIDTHHGFILEGWVREVGPVATNGLTKHLGEMTVPNKILTEMVKINLDRPHFHYISIPIQAPTDSEALKATLKELEISGLFKSNAKAEKWYNKIFKTAALDGVANGDKPIQVVWEDTGVELWLPTANKRDEYTLRKEVMRLASENIFVLRT